MNRSGTFQAGLRRGGTFLTDRGKPILISAGMALILAGELALDEAPQSLNLLDSVNAADHRLPFSSADSGQSVRSADQRSAERRLQRLASETADDNRISFGCINVPVGFYEAYLRPTLAMHNVIIYVLPEQKLMQQVFENYPFRAEGSHFSTRTGGGELWSKSPSVALY